MVIPQVEQRPGYYVVHDSSTLLMVVPQDNFQEILWYVWWCRVIIHEAARRSDPISQNILQDNDHVWRYYTKR